MPGAICMPLLVWKRIKPKVVVYPKSSWAIQSNGTYFKRGFGQLSSSGFFSSSYNGHGLFAMNKILSSEMAKLVGSPPGSKEFSKTLISVANFSLMVSFITRRGEALFWTAIKLSPDTCAIPSRQHADGAPSPCPGWLRLADDPGG